jgi:hypothetical protein
MKSRIAAKAHRAPAIESSLPFEPVASTSTTSPAFPYNVHGQSSSRCDFDNRVGACWVLECSCRKADSWAGYAHVPVTSSATFPFAQVSRLHWPGFLSLSKLLGYQGCERIGTVSIRGCPAGPYNLT